MPPHGGGHGGGGGHSGGGHSSGGHFGGGASHTAHAGGYATYHGTTTVRGAPGWGPGGWRPGPGWGPGFHPGFGPRPVMPPPRWWYWWSSPTWWRWYPWWFTPAVAPPIVYPPGVVAPAAPWAQPSVSPCCVSFCANMCALFSALSLIVGACFSIAAAASPAYVIASDSEDWYSHSWSASPFFASYSTVTAGDAFGWVENGAGAYWTDINDGACFPGSSSQLYWGIPNGFCGGVNHTKYTGVPGFIQGSQACIVLAIIFALVTGIMQCAVGLCGDCGCDRGSCCSAPDPNDADLFSRRPPHPKSMNTCCVAFAVFAFAFALAGLLAWTKSGFVGFVTTAPGGTLPYIATGEIQFWLGDHYDSVDASARETDGGGGGGGERRVRALWSVEWVRPRPGLRRSD